MPEAPHAPGLPVDDQASPRAVRLVHDRLVPLAAALLLLGALAWSASVAFG